MRAERVRLAASSVFAASVKGGKPGQVGVAIKVLWRAR